MDKQDQGKVASNKPESRQSYSAQQVTSVISNIAQPVELTDIQRPFSPLRFLLITIGGIFLAEVIAMIIVYRFQNLPYYLQTIIDASIMIVMIFPVVYFFSLKPLIHHIEKQQRTEDALRKSEARFALTFRSSPAALSVTRLADGSFLDANESFLHMFGYKREEVIGHTSIELGLFRNSEQRADLISPAFPHTDVRDYEMTARIKSGEIRSVLISTQAIELGSEASILATGYDITERKQAEERLRRVNRALIVLNECNQALVRSDNEAELLQKMCEIIVNVGEYRMAWVGLAEHDRARSVRPAAQFGFEDGYLDHAQITWADNDRGHGPTGTAIRKGVTQVNQNFLTNQSMEPWRASALLRGYQSSIALPLMDENSTFGALTIYSTSPDAFDTEEVHLLTELANDLQFGIAALHVRTERKRAEDANRRLSRIVEQTEDTVVVTNCTGEIEYVNPAFERLTGYTKEEALGKTPRLIKSGIHDNEFYQSLWNTILKGDVFQSEMANRKKNGELYYAVKTITPLRDGQGNITHFVATGKDISEHKRDEEKLRRAYEDLELRVQDRTEELRIANSELEDEINVRQQVEDALRQSEQRLSRAQEIAHLGSWELDLENNRLTWSDEVYRIFGLKPQEFGATYEAFLDAVHPDDRAAVDAAYSGSLREGRDTYEIEHRVVKRSSGEVRIVHEKCEHFRNEAGQIIRSVGMVHDITEKKKAEEALRKAHDELEQRVQERTEELAIVNRELVREIAERKEIERRLRIQTKAMEAAANGILISDRQGNIEWTNPALAQISGYDAHDLIGQSTHIFKSGQHDTTYYHQMWDTILSGQVWQGETTNRRKDGTLYIEEQTITPVLDENGQIPHFIAIKQDITKRKQAEEELEQRNVELQALSNAEHEQRQLAEALVKAAFVLNKSLNLDEVLAHILEQIREVIPYQLANITLLEGETFYDASHQGDWRWPVALAGTKNRFPLSNFPLIKDMIRTNQPVLIADTEMESNWITVHSLDWSRSFLAAPLLAEEKVIGFVNLFAGQPGFFTQKMRDRLAAFAAHAAAAIQNAWLFEQVRASSERLHSLSRRLVEIQESERLYISRELHDEAGQILTSMMLDLRLLEKEASHPEMVVNQVAKMEQSLNEVLENLHRVAMALRPASLDHLGLVAALRQHVESMGEKHSLKVSFRSGKVRERLPANVETVLYRIVQEALTNVVRHAHATQVDVALTVRDNQLIVIVEDDGIGFNPEAVSTGDHLGLFGMRERAEMIDGKLVVESAPGKGTTIMLEVGYADTNINRG